MYIRKFCDYVTKIIKKLTSQGSNLHSSEPKSDVLPITLGVNGDGDRVFTYISASNGSTLKCTLFLLSYTIHLDDLKGFEPLNLSVSPSKSDAITILPQVNLLSWQGSNLHSSDSESDVLPITLQDSVYIILPNLQPSGIKSFFFIFLFSLLLVIQHVPNCEFCLPK